MSLPENQPTDTKQTKQDEEEFDYGEEFFSATKTNDENKVVRSSPFGTEEDETKQTEELEDNSINEDLASSTPGMVNDEANQPKETNDGINNASTENEEFSEQDNKETTTSEIKAMPSETDKTEDSEKNAGEIQPQNAGVNTVLSGNQESSDDEWDELQLDTQKSKLHYIRFKVNDLFSNFSILLHFIFRPIIIMNSFQIYTKFQLHAIFLNFQKI